jgi:ribonuclease PH
MVELRLYYDDNGDYICYTCENLEGNYIVIDTQTYAEGRTDVKVIDGRLVKPQHIVIKLVPGITGTVCAIEDVCIIVDEDYNDETITWEEKIL